MSIVPVSYAPPFLFRSGHLQTIHAVLFRKVTRVTFRRERIDTPDDDFLDLDWSTRGHRRLTILSHGLEGNTSKGYIHGMARALHRRRWDVLAWNYRGCNGSPNRLPRSYHSGATEDLDLVVRHALRGGMYDEVALVGFSLGGNLTLKYVGERGPDIDTRIRRAVAFSVPCDLEAASKHIARYTNRVYQRRFMATLREKMRQKARAFPDVVDVSGIDRIRTFRDFDDRYTAPLHGFTDARDYWRQSSCKQFLTSIRIPTLLISAHDDPLLPPACYPYDEARAHPFLTLSVPRYGGHVGFYPEHQGDEYWSEKQTAAFLEGEHVPVR